MSSRLFSMTGKPHIQAEPKPTILKDPLEIVATLFEKQILDRKGVVKAITLFRLSQNRLADRLNYDSVPEMLRHLGSHEVTTGTEASTPLTYEQAIEALYGEGTVEEIAHRIGRTHASVQSYRKRVLTQGARIDRGLWELVKEGHSVEELVATLNIDPRRVAFAHTIWRVTRYAARLDLPAPKLTFTD